MREGRRQRPLTTPQRGTGDLRDGRRLLNGDTEAVELNRFDQVRRVGSIHQEETDLMHTRVIPALVPDSGAEVCNPQAKETRTVKRDTNGDDVQCENDLLEDEHLQDHFRQSWRLALLAQSSMHIQTLDICI